VIVHWINRLSVAAGSFLLAATGSAAPHRGAVAPTVISIPSSMPSNCSVANSAPALESWLNGLPANSTVEFPEKGCFNIAHSLWIHNTNGLTIIGNGAVLRQNVAVTPNESVQGILYLSQNTNLTISNLNINGAFNGSNGGANYEGGYGVFMEADHTVTMTRLNVTNIQGDFIILDPPQNGDTGSDTSLNTNISITGSRFTNAGYHGLTVESVNGLTIEHDTFTNMGVDAIDMEYDNYSTTFDANGNPQEAAEDNVMIANDYWANFNDDWISSLQGQSPGVQEDNVTLTHNRIDAKSPLVQIVGTNPYLTSAKYWNRGLTITDNRGLQVALPTTGASIVDPPGNVAAMQIQGVVGVTISNNKLPLFDGTTTYYRNTPYIAVLQAYEDQRFIFEGNTFSGAYDLLQAGSGGNSVVVECGNHYGVHGARHDSLCSSLLRHGPNRGSSSRS
jgi:hypothetical protein